ncbi:uncharacterized protein VNE69_05140 [Vairimorpha necatrix]|uniref:Uncharacterized protein n=1 Tax=Vairimorpha necatrix TaxID=6039 RepID=A0AAX4JC64_9MICR
MNSSIVITFFLFIQCWPRVYDKLNSIILNKIDKRDYSVINNERKYLKVKLNFFFNANEINAKLQIETYPWDRSKDLEDIIIICNGKSIENIVKEFEEKLLFEYKKELADSVILMYSPKYCEMDPIYKKIIEYIREENVERKKMSIRPELTYDFVVDLYCMWDRVICQTGIDLKYFREDPKNYTIPIVIVERKDLCHLNLSFQMKNMYYLFEINLQELNEETFLDIFEFKSSDTLDIDRMISKNFHDLYKFIFLEGLNLYDQSPFITFGIKRIELFTMNFDISVINNGIRFTHDFGTYFYYSKHKTSISKHENIIGKKIFIEFKDIIQKVCFLGYNYNDIELFFRLIKNENKIEFLIKRILNSHGRPLNIIFAHLMLDQELIDENELQKIIVKDKLSEERKIQLIEIFLNNLSYREYSSNTYTMKICLFLEAERYINENHVNNDSIFGTLKKIGKYIETKENLEREVTSNKSHLCDNMKITDLAKIYQIFVKHHFEDIKKFRKHIWICILELSALFTGLDKNIYVVEFNRFITQKDTVLSIFGFSKNEVDINIESIRKKLTKNSQEDAEKEYKKYLHEIKDILESKIEKTKSKEKLRIILDKIHMFTFSEALNGVITDSLNRKVEHLYDEEIKIELFTESKERVIRAIENIYRHDKIMKELSGMLNYWDENFLKKYKKEIIEKLCLKIKIEIKEKMRICCKQDLLHVLVGAFENIFLTEMNIKHMYEKYINQILLVLSEKEIFDIFEEVEVNLHDVLVKIYEDQNNGISIK